MNAISPTGDPMPVGKTIAVFTDQPGPVGSEFNVVDRAGKVLNVARITHVQVTSALNVQSGKYVVQGKVVQDLSVEHDAPFAARVYWT